ncbi:lectin-like domain-containing protein [Companilactobacillus sp. HBUAS59699]|uniref:lectin-like domain-containing protein n=1 Tax=Companilactobacillus sp. HBUAS59699 TaxID=3109358 RepID=UPI002FF02241
MRLRLNKKQYVHLVLFISFILFLIMPVKNTFAASATDDDYTSAMNGAPQGLNLDDIFVPGTFKNNVSTVVDVNNAYVTDTDAVRLTYAKDQLGAIWSTDSNYFDLNKDQTMSMWMYFGGTKNPGDGMAFVLQNDDNKTGAISTYTSKNILGQTVKTPTGGETLGVWAADMDGSLKDTEKFATTAIQKSWALEFDTYINDNDSYSAAGSASAFDVQIPNAGQHIAANYPGKASTYYTASKNYDLLGVIKGYINYMNHVGLISNVGLSNGSWHHLTMSWNASSKVMSYKFDDINSDGSENPDALTNSFTIDTDVFESENGQVRWGFTGATGSKYENNLVIFESIPDLVNATVTPSIYDETQDREIADGDAVIAKDKLKISYNLDYESGRRDWKNIVAQIKLPGIAPDPDKPSTDIKNIDYDDTAKITYADGTTDTFSIADMEDNEIQHALTETLSSTNQSATIEFTGQAIAVNRDTDIGAETSNFSSTNFITHVKTPKFTIQSDKGITIGILSGSKQSIQAGKDANVIGVILYAGGSVNITNSDFTVNTELNGVERDSFQMDNDDEQGLFQINIAAAELLPGVNTLDIYITDGVGTKSNVVTATITVTGYLSFKEVSDNVSFNSIHYIGESNIIGRNNDWKLSINDARNAGSEWKLMASSTTLTNESNTLQGGLIYNDGNSVVSIVNNPVMIASYTDKIDGDEIKDIIADWEEDKGILLRIGNNEKAGTYTGTIKWDLYDSI